MKSVGLGILFVAAMLVGAVSIFHIWEWLSLVSEGQFSWNALLVALGWMGVLAVAGFAAWQGVNRIDSGHGEHGA